MFKMLENRVIGAREPDSSVLATSCKAGHIGRATGAIGTSRRGGASIEFGACEARALTKDTSVEVEPGPHCGLGRGISAAPFTKGLTAAARHAAREIRAVWIGAIGVAAMTARELGEAARPLAFVVGAPALVTIGRYGRAAPQVDSRARRQLACLRGVAYAQRARSARSRLFGGRRSPAARRPDLRPVPRPRAPLRGVRRLDRPHDERPKRRPALGLRCAAAQRPRWARGARPRPAERPHVA